MLSYQALPKGCSPYWRCSLLRHKTRGRTPILPPRPQSDHGPRPGRVLTLPLHSCGSCRLGPPSSAAPWRWTSTLLPLSRSHGQHLPAFRHLLPHACCLQPAGGLCDVLKPRSGTSGGGSRLVNPPRDSPRTKPRLAVTVPCTLHSRPAAPEWHFHKSYFPDEFLDRHPGFTFTPA